VGSNPTLSATFQSSFAGRAVKNDDVFSRALAAFRSGEAGQAERLFKKLLAGNPRHVGGLNLLGALLTQLGRWTEAEPFLKRALRESTSSDATFYNYGLALKGLGRPSEAVEQFNRALAINPAAADTWNNRGAAFNDLRRFAEAIADFDKAISINPGYVQAYCNKGNSLSSLQLHEQALAAYGAALARAPGLAEAWVGCGNVCFNLRRFDEALAAYDRALALNPDLEAQGARLHAKQHICDWRNLDADTSRLLSAVRSGRLASVPLAMFSLSASPEDHFRCAARFAASHPAFPESGDGGFYGHDRIRVAYVSSDFNEHPVAAHILGLLRGHDRQRFEVVAISTSPGDGSDLRERIKNSSDRFVDVAATKSDQEIAESIRSAEIDIAVDLNGPTAGSRQGILARRPAPIQVNYLGYAGTIGAGYLDYILADPIAVPAQDFPFFSEKVVWLPDSFLISDNQREIAARTPSRGECGLPDSGFVFCCFNGAYKIASDVFRVWMNLLRTVDNSVLWLSDTNATAKANLWREAAQFGVAQQRLIFAPRVAGKADHLARHRQADLFLDTTPYNAHSTANDALWAGLPVLTVLGSAFPGRVAASLLHALGLPELIANSLHEYETMARRFAQNPGDLQALRTKLLQNRVSGPLFDTERSVRHIEAAYTTMYARLREGQQPAAFAVEPIGSADAGLAQ
jgi:protein O-GlcNAc transferase